MRRRQQHGDFRPRHGLEELRRDFERVLRSDPEPPRLNFAWMVPPRLSKLSDIVAGSDVALRFTDGSVLVGHYVSETELRIRFKPWGLPERMFAKSEIDGARLLAEHSYAERAAITTKQRASHGNQGDRHMTTPAASVPAPLCPRHGRACSPDYLAAHIGEPPPHVEDDAIDREQAEPEITSER